MHGTLSEVFKSGIATQMNLMGVTVLTDDRTTILKSGTNDLLDDRSLGAGVDVEIHGSFRDGRLTADRMWVGKKDDKSSELRFEGQIASIQDSHISIDTHGGGTAGVLLTQSTVIKGTMAVGKEVEVKGFLNAQLEVEAQLVKMDDFADDNGNDDNTGDDKGGNGGNGADDKPGQPPAAQPPMMKAISLTGSSSVHGDADIESEVENGQMAQHLDVEIEDAQPNATFQVQVSSSKAGTLSFALTTDAKGKGELRINSFGAGIDVRDFTGITISFNGAVILQGSF